MKKELTPDQVEKLSACKTPEEAKLLAEEENIELTDEQLEAIVAGWGDKRICPYCNQLIYSQFLINHMAQHYSKEAKNKVR